MVPPRSNHQEAIVKPYHLQVIKLLMSRSPIPSVPLIRLLFKRKSSEIAYDLNPVYMKVSLKSITSLFQYKMSLEGVSIYNTR